MHSQGFLKEKENVTLQTARQVEAQTIFIEKSIRITKRQPYNII